MTQAKIRPNKNRGLTAVLLLSGMTFLQVLSLSRILFLRTTITHDFSISDIYDLYLDDFANIVSLLTFVLYIITIIFYLRWFRRAYDNLRLLGHELRYSSAMSVGAWFIPVFHWVGPIQMMIELFQKTDKTLESENMKPKQTGRFLVVSAWWSLYVIAGLEGVVSGFVIPRVPESAEMATYIYEYKIVSSMLSFVLTILAILVVQYYRKMEQRLSMVSTVTIQRKEEEMSDIIDQG